MPGRRHASRGRRAARRHSTRSAAPSLVEITVYSLLAAAIAAGLLVAAEQPLWVAVAVVGGTLAMLALIALLGARTRHSPAKPAEPAEPAHPIEPTHSTEPTHPTHPAEPTWPGTGTEPGTGNENERPPGPRRRRHKK